jgi:hypothetical protein
MTIDAVDDLSWEQEIAHLDGRLSALFPVVIIDSCRIFDLLT